MRLTTPRSSRQGDPRAIDDLDPGYRARGSPRRRLSRSDLVHWHKTDLPMQSPHVRCWGNNGSRISVLRLVFRRRMSLARRKLEQRGSRACPNLLALLTDQPPGELFARLAREQSVRSECPHKTRGQGHQPRRRELRRKFANPLARLSSSVLSRKNRRRRIRHRVARH